MKCKKIEFYLGAFSGFSLGFFYFAYGVYTHGKSRDIISYDSTKLMQPGTITARSSE